MFFYQKVMFQICLILLLVYISEDSKGKNVLNYFFSMYDNNKLFNNIIVEYRRRPRHRRALPSFPGPRLPPRVLPRSVPRPRPPGNKICKKVYIYIYKNKS